MWFGGQSEVPSSMAPLIFITLLTFMCMGICLHVCLCTYVCLVPEELEEGVRLTEAGVMDGYKVPCEY